MKTWNQLFIRHGWKLEEKEENVFYYQQETKGNMEFLMECLEQAGVSYWIEKECLVITSNSIAEQKWIDIVDFEHRGYGGDLWFRPGEEEPKVRELDTYIVGIVRQLNRLGFYTTGSCDGHERRTAYVMVKKGKDIEQLVQLLLALGMKRVYHREQGASYHISLPLKRSELLDLAEKMSFIEEAWLDQGYELYEGENVLSVSGATPFDSRRKWE